MMEQIEHEPANEEVQRGVERIDEDTATTNEAFGKTKIHRDSEIERGLSKPVRCGADRFQ